jgi:hypothetical protein
MGTQCKIVYDKFHIMPHANDAINEGLIKGKKWLLMSRWKNLTPEHRWELNRQFELHRRVFKSYLLKESLEGL